MSQKKIYVKWYKDENPNLFNFGDDLGPYIINKLSGQKVIYLSFANSRLKVLWQGLNQLKINGITINRIINILKSIFIREYIISAGSILHLYSSKRCIVWGSGILDKSYKINKSKFLAIRGKHTSSKLISLGFKSPEIYGDPALLLPVIYTTTKTPKYKLGIIPHFTHYNLFKDCCINIDILIINLNQNNIEGIIDEICSCEKTISTSLHGIIVSHAYKIPSLWFTVESIPLRGDSIKFYDYFSSVGIPEYNPFNINFSHINDLSYLLNTFINTDNIDHIFDESVLTQIQRDLINVAPFPIKEEYLNYKSK